MRGGRRLPNTWHAILPTWLAHDSDSPPGAGETWDDGFKTPVAQWALRARGRYWVEGRIAECPRLQQNGSSDDLSFSCKNVGSSML